jgi:hypothetical protein
MSSFQGAHKVANDLAEVLISASTHISTAGWGSSFFGLVPQVCVADRSYRVLEVGFTTTTTGANTAADGSFSVGTITGGVSDAVSALLAVGTTVSTSKGGSGSLSFAADGTGKVDSDGNAVVDAGDMIIVTHTANVTSGGAGPAVLFFVRLAPIISKDVFA